MTLHADARGPHARALVADLLAMPPDERRPWYRQLGEREYAVMLTACRRELGSRYGLWQDDPVGFTEDVCGDHTWSVQRTLLESVRDQQRTVVVSTHSASKTFSGGRLVAWFGAVHPLGTAQAITTAPTFRQVKQQMWPNIAAAHAAGQLPGIIDTAQWKVGRHTVAYGFTVGENNEAALQGIKANRLLIVVDEAGGISHTLGRAFASLLSQPYVRLAVFGNAPTDEEGTWYEEQADRSALVNTIRIPAGATPNFTGEVTGRCTTCPAVVPPHRVATHLTQPEWVDEVVAEFGEDSNYVAARVHAVFPRATGGKVIPFMWVEAAAGDHPVADTSTWCRLGADVASDGGDEFAIARLVGMTGEIVHRSSGAANADPVNVANVIMRYIVETIELRDRLGEERDVHVKIDASGLGWGVAGIVKAWCRDQGLPAKVYGVRAEDRPHDGARFKNIRSEMWWNMRRLLQPKTDAATGQVTAPGVLRLRNAPTRLLAQLAGPKYLDRDGSGRTIVEKKKDMKKRTGGSPDLADALNLAAYEPPGEGPASIETASTSIPTGAPRSGAGASSAPGGGGVVIPLGPRT